MATTKEAPPQPLTIFTWGKGIGDWRYFDRATPMTPTEIDHFKASYPGTSYAQSLLTFEKGLKALQLTMGAAPPGLHFVGHPFYGTYGKWSLLLVKAGFTPVPVCAYNRVYSEWKNVSRKFAGGKPKSPWESADGHGHWIHAFYWIKPGFKGKIEFDFSKRNLSAYDGDDHNSLWDIHYGGRDTRSSPDRWCEKFARMSKNCGIALGDGLPKCGRFLDEEFYTIAAIDEKDKLPKGWTSFLEYGGKVFTHNIAKLSTALDPCPHLEQLRSL